MLLHGQALPVPDCFRQFGWTWPWATGHGPRYPELAATSTAHSWHTGPVLMKRLEAGRGALRRLPHLPAFHRRVRAVSTVVTPLALDGVAPATISDGNVAKLKILVFRSVWGGTRLSWAEEIVLSVLTPGHHISPVMRVRYDRIIWPARIAQCSGASRAFVYAIWECGPKPPADNPVGRALCTLDLLDWYPRDS